MPRYFEEERMCEECGEPFWGTLKANYCSHPCRCRAWRKRQVMMGATEVADLCNEVLKRRRNGDVYSKLYPSLFRALAVQLRKLGWDPIELLLSQPDQPVSGSDESAPGGIEGQAPTRRRWLHPPEVEIEKLRATILERTERGEHKRATEWHRSRLHQLERWVAAQKLSDPTST